MKQTLLMLLALSFSMISYSQTFTVDYITYEVTSSTNNTVQTTDYDTAGGTVVNIPNTVTNNGITYNVTETGTASFNGKQLTNVSLPSNLIVIGAASFYNNQLSSISIPSAVTTIWDNAFHTNQLTNIVIPNSVTSIGDFAFTNNQLTDITYSNNMTTLEYGVFGNNQLTSITIPSNITTLEGYVFAQNQLTSVTIPSNIASMDIGVFYNNPLTSVISEGSTPPIIVTDTEPSLDTFANRSNVNLTIPTGTMGAYVTDAGALWTGFNTVTEDASLSVDSFESVDDITIISTTDEIKINHPNSIVLQEYVVYNLAGARIIKGTRNTISKNFLASGAYILNAFFNKGTIRKKFLVR